MKDYRNWDWRKTVEQMRQKSALSPSAEVVPYKELERWRALRVVNKIVDVGPNSYCADGRYDNDGRP